MKLLSKRTLLALLFILLGFSSFAQQQEEKKEIDKALTPLVDGLDKLLFLDPFFLMGIYDEQVYDKSGNPVYDENGEPVTVPLKMFVLWLLAGGIFFTIYLKFIGFRELKYAIDI
jgi:hypothetical protein